MGLVWLLPLRSAQAIAGVAADWVHGRSGRWTIRSCENVGIAFPRLEASERAAIVRRSFRHLAWNVIDLIRTQGSCGRHVIELVDLHGRENYERARSRGRGVILLSLHLGNFELLLKRIALARIQMLVIAKPLRNPWLHRALNRFRESSGARVLNRDGAAFTMLRALRRGGTVGLLGDHYVSPRHGIYSPFFGVRVSSSPGAALLAIRSGAAICPCYAVRVAPDRHVVRILPALELALTGDRRQDVAEVTRRCNALLEGLIRHHPDQWIWAHRRFHRSPDLVGRGAALESSHACGPRELREARIR